MTLVITVTTLARSPGSFELTHKRKADKFACQTSVGMHDPGSAAAAAVRVALMAKGPYVILAPASVMTLIPPELRQRMGLKS